MARLEAGESLKSVAKDVGCGEPWLRRLRNKLVDLRPHLFPNLSAEANEDPEELAEQAGEIAAGLKEKMQDTADMLLERLAVVIPNEDRADKLAFAFSNIANHLRLMEGKPTSISANDLSMPDDAPPAELQRVAEELRARREQAPPEASSGVAQKPQLEEQN